MNTLPTLSQAERIVYLKRVSLFADLPPADLKRLAEIAQEETYADGDTIAAQGEPGDVMTIIVAGQVRITAGKSEGGYTLAAHGPGDVIGEMSVISQETRKAAMVADGDVRLLTVERKPFEDILRERPETRLAVLKVLGERLKAISQGPNV